MMFRFVECDDCSVIGPTRWGPGWTDAMVRTEARSEGWKCNSHTDLCPDCDRDGQ